jgi:hypothetical protein
MRRKWGGGKAYAENRRMTLAMTEGNISNRVRDGSRWKTYREEQQR